MANLSNFHPGEAVHCYLSSCASSSGAIVDPTLLKFTYFPPTTETPTQLTTSSTAWTTGGSSGCNYVTVTPGTSQIGLWHYRWTSTGAYPLTQWGSFRVLDPARST